MKRQLVAFAVGLWGLAVAFAIWWVADARSYHGPHLHLFPLNIALFHFGGAYLAGFVVSPLFLKARTWSSFWGAVLVTSLGAVFVAAGILLFGILTGTAATPEVGVTELVIFSIEVAVLGAIVVWPMLLLSPVIAFTWIVGAVMMHFLVRQMARRYSLK